MSANFQDVSKATQYTMRAGFAPTRIGTIIGARLPFVRYLTS